MSKPNALLVLIVREAGLRSTLVARLTMVGADVVTAAGLYDPALDGSVHSPAVLVLEEAMVDARSDEWLDGLLGDPKWHRLVLLTAAPPGPIDEGADPRLVRLDSGSAPTALAELVLRWQADD